MRDDCGILGETRLSRNVLRLMRRAAANGRDEALFGQKYIAAANEVVKKSSLRHMPRTSFCLEFPLTGKPYMDIFVNLQCGKMEAPVKFEVGDGFGLASFVNACAADETLKDYQLYFTFDLSADRHIPNVYLLPPNRKGNISYVLAMMDKLNALERKEQTATVLGKVPSGWQIYYAGFMHTRTDAPLRLGFVANPECVRGYARDSSLLARDFNVFYPGGLTEVLQEQLSLLADAIEAGAEMEIQLDLLPNGSFGDNIAVSPSLGFNYADVRRADETMAGDRVTRIMELFSRWGVSDDRWRLMGQACYGVERIAQDGDNRRLVADVVQLSAIKVRFNRNGASLAKGYLIATSWDL